MEIKTSKNDNVPIMLLKGTYRAKTNHEFSI